MHFIAGMSRRGGIICSLLASLSLQAQQASLAEAKAQIDQFWAKKVAPCGNTLALRYVAGDFNGMKGGRWTVQPGPISQLDVMNGIQWRGSTQLIAEASRIWLPNQGWQSWEQGTGFGALGVEVTKANGRWTFRPNLGSAIDNMIAPACNAVPREPTATERASALNAQMQGLCEMAKPGPRYTSGAVEIWVQQANDVNSCRDEQGRTLLMLHFLNSVYNSVGNQIALIRSGANLNVKDNRGWSALRYAVEAYHAAQARGLRDGMSSSMDRIREMIARGADPENMVDAQGNVLDQPIPNAKTALRPMLRGSIPSANEIHDSITSGRTDDIKRMLQSGVSPNLAIDDYYTLLGAAAYAGKVEIVRLLLNSGADPNLTPKGGASYAPLRLALLQNHADVAEVLRGAGAK